MNIDHVLLTRFNLPSRGIESLVRAKAGWLRDRLALFERFCLPSVAAQTAPGLRWIVYLDTESPAWLKDRMDAFGASGALVPLYREEVPHGDLLRDLSDVTGHRGDVLVTSNLDNDDGVAVDFAARIQAAVTDRRRTALYLDNGLIRQGNALYRRRDPHNAFCSVAETWDEPLTCWADWHNRLGGIMPVRNIGGQPGWLQVVHGGNVSNRVRGARVAPERYAHLFQAGTEGIAAPTLEEFLVDRLLKVPSRAVRDGARSGARRVIVGIAGKEGLDRLKSAASARLRAET
ncbi:glycosyltransferase [Sinomonas albida]|uniref:glycosyltransferase n=1 Tax=Sinomonas albida TaxID=369942 RepID=UPI0010A8C748|nr:glycosyltransferase [Sinomonas albida]